MIARFTFALLAPLSIRPSDDLPPLLIDHNGISCRVFVPQQISPSDEETSDGPVIDGFTVDEQETYLANALCVDVIGEFDRREGPVGSEYRTALAVASRMLSLFRSLARGPFVLPPDEHTTWRVRYLNDDETEFEQMDGLVRGRGTASSGRIPRAWVAPEIWHALSMTREGAPPPSDELLLDAFNLWPHIGASVVLAYTAIEVRIATALDLLVKRSAHSVSAAIWIWINNRGNFLNEPSVEEQLSDILEILSGRSLKRESPLWGAYCDLRKARNSFVHEGKSVLAGGAVVTPDKASELIARAQEIVDWIEASRPAFFQASEDHRLHCRSAR